MKGTNYTEFGKYFKILRVKNDEILMDATEYLGVSTAYISAVEHGMRSIPSSWYEILCDHFKLEKEEKNKLKKAIENSQTTIKFDLSQIEPEKRELLMTFQRSFNSLSKEQIKELNEIMNKE